MESHFVFSMEFFESRNLKPNEVILNSPFRELTSAVLGKLLEMWKGYPHFSLSLRGL